MGRSPYSARRRWNRARDDTIWFSLRADWVPTILAALVGLGAQIWIERKNDTFNASHAIFIAAAPVATALAYFTIANGIEFAWRFATAGEKNALADEQMAHRDTKAALAEMATAPRESQVAYDRLCVVCDELIAPGSHALLADFGPVHKNDDCEYRPNPAIPVHGRRRREKDLRYALDIPQIVSGHDLTAAGILLVLGPVIQNNHPGRQPLRYRVQSMSVGCGEELIAFDISAFEGTGGLVYAGQPGSFYSSRFELITETWPITLTLSIEIYFRIAGEDNLTGAARRNIRVTVPHPSDPGDGSHTVMNPVIRFIGNPENYLVDDPTEW